MASGPNRHAVLVHGAGGGGWEWNVWRRVLAAEGFEVDALDLEPGSGGLESTGFDDYVAQVRAALDAAPHPCALVGASLGGLLAMACADAADALVLVNPVPPAPWADRLPRRDWPDLVHWRHDARLASTRRALPDSDDATALYAFRRWRDESGAVLRQAHAGLLLDAPACPTLCIASALDEDVPPELTVELARAWDADLVRVASPGHVGPLLGRDAATVATQAALWLTPRL
ncbi:alpha/beta fold hydrolase [Lysobacter auxotrophicus]|uniref:Alpha/beta fold hydrolase n=1 Tax=Lysobacter auxotrophicus TaxID=2992573 RepID=A0ABM8DG96_9GAMM|nr:alpha/beta fold hydrolase [Lysobacter auxotrophicus]BDU17632.1 alpha/beta fold hydrolase [Lysobacter auxotrophicus]